VFATLSRSPLRTHPSRADNQILHRRYQLERYIQRHLLVALKFWPDRDGTGYSPAPVLNPTRINDSPPRSVQTRAGLASQPSSASSVRGPGAPRSPNGEGRRDG
jgi:hypothetical protein